MDATQSTSTDLSTQTASPEAESARHTSKFVRCAQILHCLAIIAIPALYALLRYFSEPQDSVRTLIDPGIAVIACIWVSGVVSLGVVIYGRGESLRDRIFGAYPKILSDGFFLVTSDLVMAIVLVFLAYQLLRFRQVEIYSSPDADLHLTAPWDQKIGSVNSFAKYRLPVGSIKVQFVSAADQQVRTSVGSFNVPYIWRKWEPERLTAKWPEPPKKPQEHLSTHDPVVDPNRQQRLHQGTDVAEITQAQMTASYLSKSTKMTQAIQDKLLFPEKWNDQEYLTKLDAYDALVSDQGSNHAAMACADGGICFKLSLPKDREYMERAVLRICHQDLRVQPSEKCHLLMVDRDKLGQWADPRTPSHP